MKRNAFIKILTLLCVIFSTLFTLTACGAPGQGGPGGGGKDDPTHVHTYNYVEFNEKEHWYVCDCGEKGEKQAHEYETVEFDESGHWYFCHCGYKSEPQKHYSSKPATEYEEEICDICKHIMSPVLKHEHRLNLTKIDAIDPTCTETGNIEYFICSCDEWFRDAEATSIIFDRSEVLILPIDHNYSNLKYDKDGHWYECSCGDALPIEMHIPNDALTDTLEIRCVVCDYVITPASEHIHQINLTKISATEASCTYEGNIEYYVCICGKWFTDFSATVEITDKSRVITEKANHTFNNLFSDDDCHWYMCDCGETSVRESHYGGEVTCASFASCDLCGCIYGDMADHKLSENWITNENYHYKLCEYFDCIGGELLKAEHDFNKDKICTVCNYETTALIGSEIKGDNLEINGLNVYAKVSNNQSYFNFLSEIEVAHGASFIVLDAYCNLIDTKETTLNVGNNEFYVEVTSSKGITEVYNFTVRRKPIYQVTFNTDGGSTVETQRVEEDRFASQPENPTKDGYTFNSWNFNFESPITSDIEITSNWDINEYTLTIVYDNGEENLVITKEYNAEIPMISEPTKEGFAFLGWSGAIPSYMPSQDLTITALWYANYYTLTVVYNNGQNNFETSVQYGDYVPYIERPNKVGYSFAGWDKDIPSYMPSQDLTITALWNINQYSITIVYGNGQDDKVITKNYGAVITETLPTLESENSVFGFMGWDKEMPSTMPAENVTITAIWQCAFETYPEGQDLCVIGLTDYGKTLKNLVVPSVIDGKQVKYIGGVDFNNATTFTSIVLSEGIEYVNAYAFNNCTSLESIVLPSTLINIGYYAFEGCTSLKTVDFKNGIKSIGNFAFLDCSSLENIDIPSSLEYIGNSAFRDCTSLTSVFIPKTLKTIGVAVFSGCTGIVSAEFEAGITVIPEEILTHCSSLSSVTVPNSVTEIESDAFSYCKSLKNLVLPSTLQKIGGNALYQTPLENVEMPAELVGHIWGEKLTTLKINGGTNIPDWSLADCMALTSVEIPDYIVSIGESAFDNCASLKNIYIPNSVTSIGRSAFSRCKMLESINIPDEITEIGEYLFQGCTSLKTVVIGEESKIKTIGIRAFQDCKALTNLYIPTTVESIGLSTFENCTSLQEIEIPELITTLENYIFYGCSELKTVKFSESGNLESIATMAFSHCSSLEEIEIPNGVTTIGALAFNNCSTLKSIVLPNSLRDLGEYTFQTCDSLLSIDIPNGLVTIKPGTFQECYSLASVNISTSITTIEEYAFSHSGLKSIVIPASVTTIGSYVFYDCELLKTVEFDKDSNVVVGDNSSSWFNQSYVETAIVPAYLANVLANNSLKNLIINGGTHIGELYYYTHNVEYVEIAPTVKSISSGAFYQLSNLKKVNFLGTIDDWVQIEFATNYSNPTYISKNLYIKGELIHHADIQNATKITDYAFANVRNIYSLTIGKNVTSIGSEAFLDNYRLVEVVNQSSNVTVQQGVGAGAYALTIYNGTEDYSTKLTTDENGFVIYVDGNEKILVDYQNTATEVYIPNGITKINDWAFGENYEIERVVLSSTVKTIGKYAFYYCTAINSVYISNSVTLIQDQAFAYCDGLTEVDIAENSHLESIESYGFAFCKNIKSIELPNSLKFIGQSAFKSCSVLSEVTFGEYSLLEAIESQAFYACTLHTIQIPKSVTSIGSAAFGNNSYLVIYCEASSKPYGWDNKWNNSNRPVIWSCLTSDTTSDGSIYLDVNDVFYLLKDGEALVINQKYDIVNANIPNSITYKDTVYPVTEIVAGAFRGCSSLVTVSIPSTVTTIGNNVFTTCLSLQNIMIDKENPNYSSIDGNLYNKDGTVLIQYALGKTNKTFTISATTKTISDYAVQNCTNLVYVEIPSSVTKIGYLAFDGCTAVRSIKIASTSIVIDSNAFRGCPIEHAEVSTVALQYLSTDGLKTAVVISGDTLPSRAFYNNKTIESVTLANTITSIGSEAFSHCQLLKSIEIPNSVKSIGSYAFNNCSSLKELVIPASVTTISDYAFYHCTYVTSLEIKGTSLSISSSAFEACPIAYAKIPASVISAIPKPALKRVEITGGDSIPENAFNGVRLQSITLSDSIKTIGDRAFYLCLYLSNIELPEGLVSIGDSAFYDCNSLKTIDIPSTVTHIGENAFQACGFLKTINFSDDSKLESIGSSAFIGCLSLVSIVIGENVTYVGADAFKNCYSLTIYCKAESKPSEWEQNWNSYNCTVVWGYKS